MSCSICAENLGPKNVAVPCTFCHAQGKEDVACDICVRRYLTENASTAHCMFCKSNWNTQFVISAFTPGFINGKLKRRREEMLLDDQKRMLPATHGALADEKHNRNITIQVIAQKEEVASKKAAYNASTKKLSYLRLLSRSGATGVAREANPSSFQKCPEDGCRGFLLNHECNVCHAEICKKCMTTKKEGHQCDNELVETVRMLKTDTKPCPGANCKAMITKIDGCDQMWCTACHTTFSWRTGAPIVRGNVHNPHYVAFLRNAGTLQRNPLDVECGGVPAFQRFAYLFQEMFKLGGVSLRPEASILGDIVRNFIHNGEEELPRYMPVDHASELTGLRVKYLLNELDEKHWGVELHRLYKEDQKNTEFMQVLSMVNENGATILRELYGNLKDMVKANDRRTEAYLTQLERTAAMLERLRDFSNEELSKIGVAFLNKHPLYAKDFTFVRKNSYSVFK